MGVDFNRHYWARLEKFTRDLAKAYDDVFIVTGPLFLPVPSGAGGRRGGGGGEGSGGMAKGQQQQPRAAEWRMEYPMLGKPPALMAVPTHFFKARTGEQGRRDPTALCTGIPPPTCSPVCLLLLTTLRSAPQRCRL